MSEIKAGDLVVLVKPTHCCGYDKNLGLIFRVHSLVRGTKCACGDFNNVDCATIDGWWRAELSRLKRIPPLSELDDVKRDETIEA